MKSMKQAHVFAKDHLELIISHISQHDGQTKVKETNNLVKKFETMASALCRLTVRVEDAVNGIKEKVHSLTVTYGATDCVQ
ncbi:hypothetical protein TNCT_126511 [Trichonephila clavata]|uniref:Uncharacterized protein n=1 Tax=Trichonephila clavata TaxID=2740835 RepID=A0A8X6HBM4_TRICU|nr:hypothetical protein TNCT_126511 [Trichonephila clavata]